MLFHSLHQEKGVVSKHEIKEIEEITEIKIYLEGENMTGKYIAAIILRNLSQSLFFFLITSNKSVVICTAINSFLWGLWFLMWLIPQMFIESRYQFNTTYVKCAQWKYIFKSIAPKCLNSSLHYQQEFIFQKKDYRFWFLKTLRTQAASYFLYWNPVLDMP